METPASSAPAPKEPKATFSTAARRGINHLGIFLLEDVDHTLFDLPDRKGKGGHPMYRRLNRAEQKDLLRLMKWLMSKAIVPGEYEAAVAQAAQSSAPDQENAS